jgi:hypothetical protein
MKISLNISKHVKRKIVSTPYQALFSGKVVHIAQNLIFVIRFDCFDLMAISNEKKDHSLLVLKFMMLVGIFSFM